MIQLITGIPGSGKSYFSVYKIIEHLNKGDIVIGNVDGFNFYRYLKIYSPDKFCAYIDINDNLTREGSDFFRYERQVQFLEALAHKYKDFSYTKIVYFIDEAQRYLSSYMKDSEVMYFFDYHRHLGVDIYLISQNSVKINRNITTLSACEYNAHAQSSMLIDSIFMYHQVVNEVVIRKIKLKKDEKVFACYSSFLVDVKDKKGANYVKRKIIKVLAVSIIGFIVCIWYVLYKLMNFPTLFN
jgi:zona occludens toxin